MFIQKKYGIFFSFFCYDKGSGFPRRPEETPGSSVRFRLEKVR